MPIISLWQPWANWVSLGWKPIETRKHERFKGLVGKRIGIHASLKWDKDAMTLAANYLTYEQYDATRNFLRIGGAIICTAFVREHRRLTPSDAHLALIECDNKRFGLFLEDVQSIEAIPAKGKQGIWYAPAHIA